MKKTLKKLIAMTCALTCVGSTLAGCADAFKTSTLDIDEKRTQLYVGNYDGGMGSRWLDEYKKGFEAMYKDVSFEEGKVGVQLIPLNDKTTYEASTLETSMDRSQVNVFFTERMDYYKFKSAGLLLDISDVVTAEIPTKVSYTGTTGGVKVEETEGKTIEDKLTDTQKAYYSLDGKYYGLPHYRALRGIVYDKGLFNKEGLYITKSIVDGENLTLDGKAGDDNLSKGPDGKEGTYDDGLPATYDEFFEWCDKVDDRVTPIIWNGANYPSYTAHVLDALFADAAGFEDASAYYNVPTSPKEVTVVTGFDGKQPVTGTVEVSRDGNFKKLEQLAGNYYSLEFMDRLIKGQYYYKDSFTSGHTHEEAHYDFLNSSFNKSEYDNKPIAMMVEGTWWEEEANNTFEEMVNTYGSEASRSERQFGFLPLPKPTEEYLGAPTLFDGNRAILVANANCNEVQADLAKKFIQYVSTDASLQLFNTITNIGRDYQYTLTETQQTQLTTFGQDIYDLVQSSTGIVYGYPTTLDAYNWSSINKISRSDTGSTTIGSTPAYTFKNNSNVTAKEYFEAIMNK